MKMKNSKRERKQSKKETTEFWTRNQNGIHNHWFSVINQRNEWKTGKTVNQISIRMIHEKKKWEQQENGERNLLWRQGEEKGKWFFM